MNDLPWLECENDKLIKTPPILDKNTYPQIRFLSFTLQCQKGDNLSDNKSIMCMDIDLMAKILEREGSNSGLIYIYNEDGRWMVYDRSALQLNKLLKNLMIACHVVNGAFWLPKAEVDMNKIPAEYILSSSETECVVRI